MSHLIRSGWGHRVAAFIALLIAASGLVAIQPAVADAAPNSITVAPTEHYRLMTSPGYGFQEFVAQTPSASDLANCTYDETVDVSGLKGGSLYVRLLWRDIEPVEGDYDWPMLDQLFACAEQRNITIDLRVMTSWPGAGDRDCLSDPSENDDIDHGIPCWLVQKGVSELEHDGAGGIDASYVPDWEDATIRADHAQLIRAIGRRYADHSRLNSIDIGSVGFWGEWHTYPNDADLMPSVARRKQIIDLYASSFPDTPLVMLAEIFKNQVNGDTAIADYMYANYEGRFGWRGDSWGVWGHHNFDYDPIHAANPDLWKTGPVAMEVTGVMNEWDERFDDVGYQRVLPIDTTVRDALRWHSSLAHNKASGIPEDFINDADPAKRDLRSMARKMGARLVLDRLSYADEVTAGETTEIATTWRNRGVAPLYRDFRISYRLRNSAGATHLIRTGTTLQGLLPTGDTTTDTTSNVNIPSRVAAGGYTLDVAVAYKSDFDLKMPIAITNPSDDDWYEIGPISVVGDSQVTGIVASAAVNNAAASNIVDGDGNTGWDNGGNLGDGTFTLDLREATEVTRIRYQDDFARRIRVTLDGTVVFEDWTAAAGENVFAEITPSPVASGRQLRFELLSGDWLAPEEVEVYGTVTGGGAFACASDGALVTWTDVGESKYGVFRAVGEDPFGWIGRTVGSPAVAMFTDPSPVTGSRYQIRYADQRVECSVTDEPGFACASDGALVTWTDVGESKYGVFRAVGEDPFGWIGRTVGSPAVAMFTDPSPVTGARYQIRYADQRVECEASASPIAESLLIDMHNDFLLGQHHVWTPLNSNQGPVDAAAKKVQTFRFTQRVTAGSTAATYEVVSVMTELDQDELVVYAGVDGGHLVSKVANIDGNTVTFEPPIEVTQANGTEFWSLYGDAAHPNVVGYRALGDFVFGEFSPAQIDSMRDADHLFLGDSWMEAGPADDGRLADRITELFDGTIRATNKGVGGRTAAEVEAALVADFPPGQAADFVWLIVGTNDYYQDVPPADFRANVAAIVEYAESRGAIAIVVNSSVGALDGTLDDPAQRLKLSRRYVGAEQRYFDRR